MTVLNSKLDNHGRFIILDVQILDKTYSIVCIYAPNIDSPSFFDRLSADISGFACESVIIGGDLNFVFNTDIDKKGGVPQTNFHAREHCLELMNVFDLVDVWRERNPFKSDFTWSSNTISGIHCRLDCFLISRHLLQLISNCYISPGLHSDHSLVILNIHCSSEMRGPRYWKLNNSLLQDSIYVDQITRLLHSELNDVNDLNPSAKWEFIKYKVRMATTSYSKLKAKQHRHYERNLLNKISQLERSYYELGSVETLRNLKETRSELESLYHKMLDGIIVRSRAQWVEFGERNSKYFLNLEKHNKANNVIHRLKTDNNDILIGKHEVLANLRDFYATLYTSGEVDPSLIFSNIFNYNKLSMDEADCCDGPMTSAECVDALNLLSIGKSPGSDGLSVEFYKKFWPVIGDCVVNALNYANTNFDLSAEQGRAIITLIPKHGKDKDFIKNYRPISLLNTDYKICAKVLSTRIKLVLPKVISNNQTGFLKNRFIGENVRFVLDLIEYCNTSNKTGLLFLVDFEKAFDSVEWEFIFTSLRFFGFGESFINWVKTMYSNNSARIINNGYSCLDFKISRGVRQGCPLSPYIFLICAEVLTLCVNDNNAINGISLFDNNIKILQYADDTTMFLDGSYSSLKETISTFSTFEKSSGLKVNVEKSSLFPLGRQTQRDPWFRNIFGLNWSNGPVALLGVSFTNNRSDLFSLNFPPKLSRLKRLLGVWSQRDLTPMGKVTIVKALGLSQLVYLFQILPNPPQEFITELDAIIFRFIWSGKPEKIRRSSMIGTISSGGLNVTHTKYFIHSLKCTWVNRYNNSSDNYWKLFFDFHLKKYGKSLLFNCNYKIIDIHISNAFIYDVCHAWSLHSFIMPNSNYGEQIIWNNSFIKINNKMVFYNSMFQKGIWQVKHLFDNDNRPYCVSKRSIV